MIDDVDDRIEQQLEQLDKKSEALFQQCRLRSALRLAREATHTARSRQRVVHYMRGLFDQMRFGHGLLDPTITREASVELIALLEDEEQARRIQPDLDEHQYRWVCSWMSSCAYDNLAESTGRMSGYNSAGLHECISDGIQVCRRTGKLDCIKCFREYAADVYLASDDLDMTRFQCQALLDYRGDDKEKKDRRWSAHQKLAWIELLEGRLSSSAEEILKAQLHAQAPLVYLKMRAQLLVAADLNEIRLLSGQGAIPVPESITDDEGNLTTLPGTGEWPRFELAQAKEKALALTIDGKYEDAVSLLTDWDRRLTQQSCLHDWFEVRLRLIALYRIAGKPQRAESLSKGLDAQARESQDFLTLRRLAHLNNPAATLNPLATLADLDGGPFAGRIQVPVSGEAGAAIQVSGDQASSDEGDAAPSKSEPGTLSPLEQELNQLTQQFVNIRTEFFQAREASGDDDAAQEKIYASFQEQRNQLLDQLLSFSPESLTDPRDAAQIAHLLQYLVNDEQSAMRSWDWSLAVVNRFETAPLLLNVVASLGGYFLRSDPDAFSGRITSEQLETWFRKSLILDPDHARNHLRAGEYFRDTGQPGEAERILARAFRLDRAEPQAALSLSELYLDTERPRDALGVLDMSLREGCMDPRIAWEAGIQALNQHQYDAVVTYMDRHLAITGEQPWIHYYRAWGLLETQRFTECLEALDREASQEPSTDLHLNILRVCGLDALEQNERAQEVLKKVLDVRLASTNLLSGSGFARLFGRLWTTVSAWSPDEPLRVQLQERLLQTGLMPDEYFEDLRAKEELTDGVNFYKVCLRQPLDGTWAESCCSLPGQEDWVYYNIEWGVLATSEEEAVSEAIRYQSRCYHIPASLVQVEERAQGFRDYPGVVWQGHRWSESDSDEQDGLDDLD